MVPVLFRLCGHNYCVSCLKAQVQASKSVTFDFPLLCAEGKCYKPILLTDLKKVVGDKEILEFTRLAVKRFVTLNKTIVRQCSTVDCPYIYLTTASQKKYSCPGCKFSMCSFCHQVWHEGIPCEISNTTAHLDPRINDWIQNDPKSRKLCPSCLIGIEKKEGCNRVICSMCNQDLCWLCLRVYKECSCSDTDAENDLVLTDTEENDSTNSENEYNELQNSIEYLSFSDILLPYW